jgi:Amidase
VLRHDRHRRDWLGTLARRDLRRGLHKPTFGLLSGDGILAGEPADPAIVTLGHPCITARSAEDVASVLRAILAVTRKDSTPMTDPLKQRRRVGVVTNFTADTEITDRFASVRTTLATMDVALVNVEAPFAAASFDLRNVESDRASIDATLLRDVDAIVLPTLATTTPTVAEARAKGDMAVSPQNTFFANYFGLPAVTVPLPMVGMLGEPAANGLNHEDVRQSCDDCLAAGTQLARLVRDEAQGRVHPVQLGPRQASMAITGGRTRTRSAAAGWSNRTAPQMSVVAGPSPPWRRIS